MKFGALSFAFILLVNIVKAQSSEVPPQLLYQGKDLGLTYTRAESKFRVWAPYAEDMELKLYDDKARYAYRSVQMNKSIGGTWLAVLREDLAGKSYTFRVKYNNQWSREVTDPYVKAVTVNGEKGAVVDLKNTDPPGWTKDKGPTLKSVVDAVIYELHIRDASISATSGIQHKGKYIGLTETGTRNSNGEATGLDHLSDLGITHVHLLPFCDYRSVDETRSDSMYNWGYDPLNYNSPEGSYATDVIDPAVRIREFKQLINAFHKKGLGVIMDVVYNHTGLSEQSNFNTLVPGYYYRHDATGKFSNATACGNETASEKAMMRKFMVESVLFWAKEYHIDGFRFDLMGVHDIETMNLISSELHKLNPGIIIYGEGWTAGASPIPDSLRALKKNVSKLDRIAVFSDDIRDGIKGSVFDHADKGFASGKSGMDNSIRFGIVAAIQHPQVDYSKVNYSKSPYATQPSQVISYAECHDNHTLWDKLAISAGSYNPSQRVDMHKLALSIVLTSQGISFLHAGTEFLRSKQGVENSYNSPDSINAIDWSLKTKHHDVYEYVRSLVRLRRDHPAFRMRSAEQIRKNLKFIETSSSHVVAYTINGQNVKDSWSSILVIFNGGDTTYDFSLPIGNWKTGLSSQGQPDLSQKGKLSVPAFGAVILYQ